MRFAQWKVKYQRITGYVSLATFLIVLYQLARDLWASPYLPWRTPDFNEFVALVFVLFAVLFAVVAEWDWRRVFPSEIGVSHSKDPMFFSTAFRDAVLLYHLAGDDQVIESILDAMYRSVDRGGEFEHAKMLVRRSDAGDKGD